MFVSNIFYKRMGISYPIEIFTFLGDQTIKTIYTNNFLSTVFDSATALLLMISSFLIYMVSMVDVNEKTFEFGSMRMLGV